MQKDYHSVSFSSASRSSGTPEKYVFNLTTPQENVRQLRLGTLELPHMVQPNVVQGQNNRLVIQELNDSVIVVTGVSDVIVSDTNQTIKFTLDETAIQLTAGGAGDQFRQYPEGVDLNNLLTETTFQASAASFHKRSDDSFEIQLYETGPLDLSQPLYLWSFDDGNFNSIQSGAFTTVSFSPALELTLPTSYYSTQELLDHFNTRLNIGYTAGQAQTFRYKVIGNNPVQASLFDPTAHPGTYRVSRCDILDAMKVIPNLENLLTFNANGGFDFDLSNLEYLDFTGSNEALVHMLGVDKTMYFESFSSPHDYYPTCQKYLIIGQGTATDNGQTISHLTLNEPISSYYINQLIMVQTPANNTSKTIDDYYFPRWTMAKITKMEGKVLVLDRKVTTRTQCFVALFPEPRNIYQMSANTDLKFELLVRLPYNNNRVRVLQSNVSNIVGDYPTTMNRVLGLNDQILESDETQRLVFPNQYNTDPIPYILMYITNLGTSLNNHTHISPNGDQTHPLAKIVLQSPFHINRHQIMEMDFVSSQKIRRLDIEFRNPDGTLCYFQGRDHTISLGFVIDRPTLQLTSGSLTGAIDPGVHLG